MPVLYRLLYGCGVTLFTIVFRGIFSTRVTGLEHVPRDGGLLVVCNHISLADPPMIAIALPRRIEFMTMAEMFRQPVLGWIVRNLRCIPVDRSRPDQVAAREAIRRLRAGRCVAIFPEGGIRTADKSVLGGDPEFKPGAGAIAVLGGVPILPVIVRDTRVPYHWRNWLPCGPDRCGRATMRVTCGHPFCLWIPESLDGAQRRKLAREVLRAQLLKSVELE